MNQLEMLQQLERITTRPPLESEMKSQDAKGHVGQTLQFPTELTAALTRIREKDPRFGELSVQRNNNSALLRMIAVWFIEFYEAVMPGFKDDPVLQEAIDTIEQQDLDEAVRRDQRSLQRIAEAKALKQDERAERLDARYQRWLASFTPEKRGWIDAKREVVAAPEAMMQLLGQGFLDELNQLEGGSR